MVLEVTKHGQLPLPQPAWAGETTSVPQAHGDEAQGGVLQESEEGVLQVFCDEEMEKLEAIPGVLAVEMGFL